jgi:hypothetical protein
VPPLRRAQEVEQPVHVAAERVAGAARGQLQQPAAVVAQPLPFRALQEVRAQEAAHGRAVEGHAQAHELLVQPRRLLDGGARIGLQQRVVLG